MVTTSLLTPSMVQPTISSPITEVVHELPKPEFPDRTKVVAEQRAAKEQAEQAALEAAQQALDVAVENVPVMEPEPATEPYIAPKLSMGGLVGVAGWTTAGGNCVDLAKQYGKNQNGDPIGWGVSTSTPFIGAAALFYYNHVAIVSGIWDNGDVELMHYNCPGCATRVPASSLRGFF